MVEVHSFSPFATLHCKFLNLENVNRTMDLINKSDKNNSNIKELIAIEYPARVENIDKVIDTLGGKEDLSKSFSEHERLQLQFRNNFCAKPVLSSEVSSS